MYQSQLVTLKGLRGMATGPRGVLMTKTIDHKMAAELDGGFALLLIGMRVNKPWKVHKWLPVFLGMPKMLKELQRHPESGFLGYSNAGSTIVQYWRSVEDVQAFARSRDMSHWPAWVAFNRRSGRARGDVGIWHELYRVRAGDYEAIYSGMPRRGLGAVGRLVPATGRRESASTRMAATVSRRALGWPPALAVVD